MKKTLYIPIAKVDEEKREVWGYATSEAIDSQGDIIDYEASKRAFSSWVGNIREMHDEKRVIGKAIDIQFDDLNRRVLIGAKISESADGQNAWTKVKEGLFSGFSIGGMVHRVVDEMRTLADGANETVRRILDYTLAETSLVDNPANPEARLVMVKQIDGDLQRVEEDGSTLLLPQAWWVNKYLHTPMKKSDSDDNNTETNQEDTMADDIRSDEDVKEEVSEETTEATEEVVEETTEAATEETAEEVVEEEAAEVAEAEEVEAAEEVTTEETTEEDSPEEEKSSLAEMKKSLAAIAKSLSESKSADELQKAVKTLKDEVVGKISSLEDRLSALEKSPAVAKAKASYVVGKGDEESEVSDELAALQKRADELAKDPSAGTLEERNEVSLALLKAARKNK